MPMIRSEVFEAVRGTFEEMAFLDVAEGFAPEGESAPNDGPVLALSYTTPKPGSFSVCLPKALKFQVAEAIYGEDESALSAGQLDDSLLELMNVLAGRLLAHRFGKEGTYKMGLPTIFFDPPDVVASWSRQEFPFHVDQWSFILVWSEEAS